MTVLFLVGVVVIVAAIIFKLETSKPKVTEPEKKLEVITVIEPEVIQEVVEPKVVETPVIEPTVEETPKKVIELKPKTVTKTATKTKTVGTTKTKKSEK